LEHFEVAYYERFQFIDCLLKVIKTIVWNRGRDGRVQSYFTRHGGSETSVRALYRPSATRPRLYQLLTAVF